MALPLTHRRFTVDEYHKMAEAGILAEDDRVEQLDGEIVEMSPIGRRHAGAVNRLTRLFTRSLGDSSSVSVQNPVLLSHRTMGRGDSLLPPRFPNIHLPADDILGPQDATDTEH